MNIQGNITTVNKSQEDLFNFLTNVGNFKNIMPENIEKFERIGEDGFIFGLKGMPEIKLEMKEKTPCNKVVLGAMSDKLPFTLSCEIKAIDNASSEAQLTFDGDFNAMMAMMIKGPITKFVEQLTLGLGKL